MVLHVAIINTYMVKKQNWFIITHARNLLLCVMSLCDDLVKCVCVCVCVYVFSLIVLSQLGQKLGIQN